MTPAQTTVVLPVWDDYVGPPLLRALESLRADNDADAVIVVDNASRVPLPELEGVRVIRSATRLTLGAARNLGLAEVATPFVVVWDADDVMLPGTLPLLESAIGADSRLAAFGAAIIEEPSGERHRWPRPWALGLGRMPRLFALANAVWSLYPTTGATLMRTELVRAAGGYSDAESGDDWSLGVTLAFRGRVGWTERPGRIYLVHHHSVWARHMSAGHQLKHAREIRARLRADPAVSQAVRLLLPVIAVGQYAAVGAHLLVKRLRGRAR